MADDTQNGLASEPYEPMRVWRRGVGRFARNALSPAGARHLSDRLSAETDAVYRDYPEIDRDSWVTIVKRER